MKKLVFVISILAVFGLSIAAFAYTRGAGVRASESCCMGDACPMKQKKSENAKEDSCCDKCDGCKGDSCPMKKQQHTETKTDAATAEVASQNVVVAMGENCCSCACCGGEKKSLSELML